MFDPFFTTVNSVVSFLEGGTVSALINRLYIAISEKRERKIKFPDDQLRNLYGPLYYFVSQSKKYSVIHRNVLKAMATRQHKRLNREPKKA